MTTIKKKNRTDIAYEELYDELDNDECSYHRNCFKDIVVNHVQIHKEQNQFNRVVGDYIGIEFKDLYSFEVRENIIQISTDCFKQLLKQVGNVNKVLVVGLGNRDVIADALGCRTCEKIYVSAHLECNLKVAVITPNVAAKTGLETVQIVKSICDFYNPNLIIVIDALATKDISRLNRVIQITNTGIQPGSGIGYSKGSIDKQSMGIPVIAIGVSTVIDVESIVYQVTQSYEFVLDTIENLIVTPKEMDFELLYLSNMVASIINKGLFHNMQ